MKRIGWRVRDTVVALGLWLAGSPACPAAQSVSESFVGTATLIAGDRTGVGHSNYLASQFIGPILRGGRAEGVNGNTLTDSQARWADGAFNGSNGPCYVEFDSGLMVDVTGTDAASKTLTLAGSIDGKVDPGSRYRVRPHLTLSSFFGSTNDAGLLPGANANRADNVLVDVTPWQQVVTIFYTNGPDMKGWYRDDLESAGEMPIFPEQGINWRRRAATSAMLYQAGTVRQGVRLVPIAEGTNLVSTMQTRRSLKLTELNLYTGDGTTGLVGATNVDGADLVIVLGASRNTTAYYSTRPGAVGWYDALNRPLRTTVLPPGVPFYVIRKTPHGSFTWTVPAP